MEDWLKNKGLQGRERNNYISLLQLVTSSKRAGILTRRITACEHCRCKRISPLQGKNISGERVGAMGLIA